MTTSLRIHNPTCSVQGWTLLHEKYERNQEQGTTDQNSPNFKPECGLWLSSSNSQVHDLVLLHYKLLLNVLYLIRWHPRESQNDLYRLLLVMFYISVLKPFSLYAILPSLSPLYLKRGFFFSQHQQTILQKVFQSVPFSLQWANSPKTFQNPNLNGSGGVGMKELGVHRFLVHSKISVLPVIAMQNCWCDYFHLTKIITENNIFFHFLAT